MRTQRKTLSFLTGSKASAVGGFCVRRVAITLLVMLLTTVSAWAQDVPTFNISTQVTPDENWGTITAPEQAQMHKTVQFTVTPADGYKIKSVSLSDRQVSNTLEGSPQTGIYSFTMGTSNVTITAVFKENIDKTITFNANGGTGTMAPVTVDKGTEYTIPECGFTGPNNRAFLGWGTSADDIVVYQPGDKVTINKNLTLYAVWDDNPSCKLTYKIISESEREVELSGYEGDNKPAGRLIIPSTVTIEGKKYFVTSIGNSAFYGCYGLTSVIIPNSVTSIGDFAFLGCSSLTSVTIPNGVTNIGGWAFKDCSSLQSVVIPNNVKNIKERVFQGCISLQSVTIPNGVTSIGISVFDHCSSLQSVIIPNSVTVCLLHQQADFYHCATWEAQNSN